MKRIILIITILGLVTACRSKRHIGEEYPFRSGFQKFKWGAQVSDVDSLIWKDTTWKKISSVINSNTNGRIVVIKDKEREYYLEFDESDRFFLMNYISGKNDLDSVRNRLQRYYGEPDQLEKTNENYQNHVWNIDADSIHLEIQMLVTHKQYALKVLNKGKR